MIYLSTVAHMALLFYSIHTAPGEPRQVERERATLTLPRLSLARRELQQLRPCQTLQSSDRALARPHPPAAPPVEQRAEVTTTSVRVHLANGKSSHQCATARQD